ncbi:hypothetical protein [Asticcacaulis sp. AND118]|jgi:hypothetical protein|uniref:hypothetical protein n=1 Tax=Asticcacaulis sp. AND118 TaxID=2840468 RepID=UPI001CFFC364|nr:hypothetical protein [Asticcacaulis sp. AND118]UDF04075.1 hypothetical protein LH365_03270 [Asticcacaulis sp. AND118]
MAKAVDFQNLHQIEKLHRALGDAECRRLGFVIDDDRDVATLTTAGLGFLIATDAQGVSTVAEAFAAGYQCAAEFHERMAE